MKTMVYAGTFGTPLNGGRMIGWGKGEGVYAFELNTSGALTPVNLAYARDAGIVRVSPDHRYLYAANESRDFAEGLSGSGGGVTAFAIDQRTGGLSPINSSIAYGACTAFVTVSADGRFVLAANHGSHPDNVCRYVPDGSGGYRLERGYDDTSVAVFRVREDGGIGEITDLKVFEGHGYFVGQGQSTSHIHSVNIRADGLVIACNRGADRVEVLQLDENGKLRQLEAHACRAGLAPRHAAIHPTKPLIYVCNENYPFVTTFEWDGQTLRERQILSACPADRAPEIPENTEEFHRRPYAPGMVLDAYSPSDIQLDPLGRFVYVSVRGEDGGIAVFGMDEGGMLSLSGYCSIDDPNPRGFHVSPDGRFLVAGLMATGRLAVYPIDGVTGLIGAAASVANVPSVCSVQVVGL